MGSRRNSAQGGKDMSAISTKIFGHDTALDVKNFFCELYGLGYSVEEIEECFLNDLPDEDDIEELCPFWTGFALVEWEYGVLSDFVRDKAKDVILNYSDVTLFFTKKDQEARAIELQKLYEKLDTVNPKPKKRRKTFVFRTEWNHGDIYAIQICNKFIYFHVCGIFSRPYLIEGLYKDELYIKVFDCISDELLGIEHFQSGIKYKQLDTYFNEPVFLKWLWCIGVREKTNLEKKVILVGNLSTENERVSIISGNYQFREFENTLCRLFGLS